MNMYVPVDLMHTETMHMYAYHKMYTCNERYFLMFLECNNHEAHGPTDYHAYICTCMYAYNKQNILRVKNI